MDKCNSKTCKVVKDLKERNDKLNHQYRLRDIRCITLEQKLHSELKALKSNYKIQLEYDEELEQRIKRAIEKLKYYGTGEANYYIPIDDIIDILKGSEKNDD